MELTNQIKEVGPSKNLPIKGALVLASLIVIIILGRLFVIGNSLESFNLWVEDLGKWGYITFFGIFVFSTVLLLPGSVLTLGAGFSFGMVVGSLVASISATVGASLAFLIARYLARDTVLKKLNQNVKFAAVDSAIGREGGKIVLLLRLNPISPFNTLNYFLGLTAVRFWSYLLASWIGMIPGTILYVYLGVAGKAGLEAASGKQGRSTLEYILLGIGLIATLILTIYIAQIARKALQDSELHGNSVEP